MNWNNSLPAGTVDPGQTASQGTVSNLIYSIYSI